MSQRGGCQTRLAGLEFGDESREGQRVARDVERGLGGLNLCHYACPVSGKVDIKGTGREMDEPSSGI